MDIVISVIFILGALLVGAMSPGPSFVLVARVAMSTSRNDGIATSVGMGVGGLIFSVLSLLGLHNILTSTPELYYILKICGGLYLIFMGIRIWRGASESLEIRNSSKITNSSIKKSFFVGLITQVSNPKTAIVYGSIFAALLPSNIPNALYYILPPLVFLVEAGWYLLVTFILSSASPRAVYLRSKPIFDRLAGGVMAGLGSKLIFSASN